MSALKWGVYSETLSPSLLLSPPVLPPSLPLSLPLTALFEVRFHPVRFHTFYRSDFILNNEHMIKDEILLVHKKFRFLRSDFIDKRNIFFS